jgi:hypothetical protein
MQRSRSPWMIYRTAPLEALPGVAGCRTITWTAIAKVKGLERQYHRLRLRCRPINRWPACRRANHERLWCGAAFGHEQHLNDPGVCFPVPKRIGDGVSDAALATLIGRATSAGTRDCVLTSKSVPKQQIQHLWAPAEKRERGTVEVDNSNVGIDYQSRTRKALEDVLIVLPGSFDRPG